MLAPALLGLGLALALLALLPTRRLFLAGWPTSWLAAYYLSVLVLAMLVAEMHGAARFLIPLLVVVYVAPFVTVREGLARLLGRGPAPPARREPPKNVTPPGTDGRGGGRP